MRHHKEGIDQVLIENQTSNGDWYDDGQERFQQLIDEANIENKPDNSGENGEEAS
jgi:hypothetical protein